MSQFRRIFLIALVLLLISTLGLDAIPGLAQSGSAMIRFVHAIPGASAIDIYTDGHLSISKLAYGGATNYIDVPVGSHHLTVTQSGATASLWEQDISPAADGALTLVASTAAQPTFTVFQDDLNSLPLGKARFTAINAAADAASVDLLLSDGRPVIPGLQYNQPYGTLDLPVASYDMAVVATGQPVSAALLPAQPYNLNTGTSYIAVVYGTKDAPKTLLLAAPTRPESAGGYARIAHVIAGAPAADVYVNNTLVASSLAPANATDYIALPTGSYTVSVRATGTSTDLATATLDVAADARQTVLIMSGGSDATMQVMTDAVGPVNETSSVLTLINTTSAATISASTADGKALVGSVAAGKSDSALLAPSVQGVSVSVNAADSQTPLLTDGVYGGVYYSVVAVDSANGVQVVPLPAVSLAQGSASAPAAAAPVPPAAQPTAAVAPTEAPAPTQAEVQPTPTLESAVIINAQPTAVPTTVGPTARVLVDPTAHLQLRQYPSREAFSLGLASAGETLVVNGRAGAPVPPVDTTATPLPPNATPFVDPATLLQQNQDLDPTLTWLNVTYTTPDGGSINAWVLAVYLSVRDSQGRSMALRDLPVVPSNRAGQAQNTSVQPPSPTEIVTMAIATNVSPGVRVHIRRTPDVAGESLALIPAGTQMQFLGVAQKQDWVFVSYSAPQSTVTGWVSVEFVTLQRNNQPVDFARLQVLNILTVIDTAQRGSVVTTGQVTPVVPDALKNVVAGTVSGLNADANLHLRRTASDQGESLALFPNGTTFVVNGHNEDSTWLQVTYQNQTGWVSSQFVTLTFNGQASAISDLPLISTTPTPTATATAHS